VVFFLFFCSFFLVGGVFLFFWVVFFYVLGFLWVCVFFFFFVCFFGGGVLYSSDLFSPKGLRQAPGPPVVDFGVWYALPFGISKKEFVSCRARFRFGAPKGRA